jgi:ABC-2 type transport system permease protein
MNKIWLVAENTFRPGLRTGSFLFLTFVIPVLMVAAGLVGFFIFSDESELELVGYVDQAGIISPIPQVETASGDIRLVRYEELDQAQAAFLEEAVQAYLLVPAGYLEGAPVTLYAEEPLGSEDLNALARFLRMSLLPGVSPEMLDRVEAPAELVFVESTSGIAVRSEAGLLARFLAPALMAVLFAMAVAFMTSQLGSAVLREKENRAMEIVITSLRPIELVAGKVLGMAMLAVTQFALWITGGVIAVMVFTSGGSDLPDIALPWNALLWGLLLIPPGYLLFAMLASGLGIIAGDGQQAQQLAGLLGLFAFVPVWFTPIWLNDPYGSAATILTLFPLTAPSSVLFRLAFATVPTWQLAASFLILVLSLLLAVWAVARIFRAAMLVYGKSASVRLVWQSLRQA